MLARKIFHLAQDKYCISRLQIESPSRAALPGSAFRSCSVHPRLHEHALFKSGCNVCSVPCSVDTCVGSRSGSRSGAGLGRQHITVDDPSALVPPIVKAILFVNVANVREAVVLECFTSQDDAQLTQRTVRSLTRDFQVELPVAALFVFFPSCLGRSGPDSPCPR